MRPVRHRFWLTTLLLSLLVPAIACRPHQATRSNEAASPPSGRAPQMRIVANLFPLCAYTRLIGSPAPPIDVAEWCEPASAACEPFRTFAPGRVYVLVFWASWCPYSREAFPVLAGLAERYGPRGVTVVGITNEEPADVRAFLEQPAAEDKAAAAAAARCCLAADPDESVQLDYMQAIDEIGVPTAFVVGREGLVEWIGHVVDLEQPLSEVAAGTWDRQGFRQSRQKLEAIRSRMCGLMEQGCGREFADATAALEALVAERHDDAEDLNEIGWLVFEFTRDAPVAADILATAVGAVNRSLQLAPDQPNTLDTLAHLELKRGRLAAALEAQRRAVYLGGPNAVRYGEFLRHLESQPSDGERRPEAESGP